MIEIFSDGACFGNPGPGAYATIIRFEDGREEILTKFSPQTTNNRMELMGVISGLSFFNSPERVVVYTDSQYVTKGITEWMPKWTQNNWHSKVTGQPIKNIDLWQRLQKLTQLHRVEFQWVRGHVGHPENERCNMLAQKAIKSHTKIIKRK